MNPVVIVGIGEIADRPAELAQGLDPIGLMVEATARACDDAGIAADAIDAVDIVHQISWRYDNTARQFGNRMGIDPARARYHPGGGDSPMRLIHEAALAIARGERRVTLVVGGEARNTAAKAQRAGIDLPWSARAAAMEHPWNVKLNPLAIAHGVIQPTFVYPFYENAWTAANGQSPAEGQRLAAELWAGYSAIAATNPYAWAHKAVNAVTIATPSEQNPMIAYPYTRLMVANPTVNQGAAILLMSETEARERGVPPERMIYLHGGAAAREPEDYLKRDRFDHAAAQDVVLDRATALVHGKAFDAVELYSCFPCVPKMAAQALGLADWVIPTVAGGLTFFGGPFNNYMTHATAAMVRRLRDQPGLGLLYGQGDFVTKHHALLLGSARPTEPLDETYRLDDVADAARGAIPPIVDRASGAAVLETFTILYDRAGQTDRGVTILRLPDGARTMARVVLSDVATLARLADPVTSPVGTLGTLSTADDGLLEWRVA